MEAGLMKNLGHYTTGLTSCVPTSVNTPDFCKYAQLCDGGGSGGERAREDIQSCVSSA